jgi:hypothetical protein
MGVYYLQHPVHGIHVATTDVEANACKANGWSDWTPGDPDPVLSPRQPVVAAVEPKSAESEVETLKAQMAAMAAQIAALTPKPEPPPAKGKSAPAAVVPDFLKG